MCILKFFHISLDAGEALINWGSEQRCR
uniref:Uncharacterized protein n=1 Tax=Ralstonia syzygii R24 TaxID=907261 RepID=G3AC15_9RALS|nr:hypothetical protein RALSY_mp30405 [Ralstonia syzygii R24]